MERISDLYGSEMQNSKMESTENFPGNEMCTASIDFKLLS